MKDYYNFIFVFFLCPFKNKYFSRKSIKLSNLATIIDINGKLMERIGKNFTKLYSQNKQKQKKQKQMYSLFIILLLFYSFSCWYTFYSYTFTFIHQNRR